MREFVAATVLKAKFVGFLQMRCFPVDLLFSAFAHPGDLFPDTHHWSQAISAEKYNIFVFLIKHMGQIRK